MLSSISLSVVSLRVVLQARTSSSSRLNLLYSVLEITWRDDRVVDGTGLENRRGATHREFESRSLRQENRPALRLVYFLAQAIFLPSVSLYFFSFPSCYTKRMQPSESQQPENWQQPQGASTEEFHPVVEATPAAIPEEEPVAPQDEVPIDGQSQVNEDPSVAPVDEAQEVDGDEELIRWQASEFIHHERPPLWYVVLTVVVLGLIAVAVFLLHSITFAVLVPVMAAALIVYTRRPPAAVQYTLSRKGVHINDKLVAYDLFRAFSIVSHDGHHSIILIPRKRFAISETLYFPEEAGEAIVDMLAARLPMKDAKPDIFDRIISKLKM